MGVLQTSTEKPHSLTVREDTMDSKLVISTSVFLLLTFIDTGSCQEKTQCYQCNSYVDANCADPFFYEEEADKRPEDRTMKDPSMLQDCPEDEPAVDGNPGKQHFCRKITQTVRGYTRVLEEYNTLVCACEGKGCNGAAGFSVSMFAT